MASALSIVTVVKDDPNGLARTRDSLNECAAEDLSEIEWIVIDSSANCQAVPQIVAKSTQPASVHWVAPEGVYEAMNAGLQIASGDYVYFLNAGDRLRDAHALHRIIQTIKEHRPQWFYGQVGFIDAQNRETIPPPFYYHAERKSHFSQGRFPPHQGTIARRDLLQSIGGFDTSYRITADYTAMLRMSLIADPIELTDVVATFETGGLSEKRWLLAINEFHRARLEILKPRGWALATEFASTAQQALRMGAPRAIQRRKSRRLP